MGSQWVYCVVFKAPTYFSHRWLPAIRDPALWRLVQQSRSHWMGKRRYGGPMVKFMLWSWDLIYKIVKAFYTRNGKCGFYLVIYNFKYSASAYLSLLFLIRGFIEHIIPRGLEKNDMRRVFSTLALRFRAQNIFSTSHNFVGISRFPNAVSVSCKYDWSWWHNILSKYSYTGGFWKCQQGNLLTRKCQQGNPPVRKGDT